MVVLLIADFALLLNLTQCTVDTRRIVEGYPRSFDHSCEDGITHGIVDFRRKLVNDFAGFILRRLLRRLFSNGLNIRLGHCGKRCLNIGQPLHGKRDGTVQRLYHSCQSLYVATLGEVVRQIDLYRFLRQWLRQWRKQGLLCWNIANLFFDLGKLLGESIFKTRQLAAQYLDVGVLTLYALDFIFLCHIFIF